MNAPRSELELIAALRGGSGRAPEWLELGIGDDAAVLVPPGTRDASGTPAGASRLMVSTDCAVDGVHFEIESQGCAAVAGKAVRAALSDIAAMGGGHDGWILAAVAFDLRRPDDERIEILETLRRTALDHGFTLIGGDITAGAVPTTFCITVAAWSEAPLTRAGASAGDRLCVTGELGGSLVTGRHLHKEPRLELVRALRRSCSPTAMIDISDGLASEALHLCREGRVGAVLDLDALPLHAEAGGDPERALGDGEDYELLFTLPAAQAADLPAELEGVRLSIIGEMIEGEGLLRRLPEGGFEPLTQPRGWDPLRGAPSGGHG